MELEKRKVSLIAWITQLENEKVLEKLERLKTDSIEENVPDEILDLLKLSEQCPEDRLVRHTQTKDLLSRK
ncbi:hypothetical protein J0A68_03975 [Algoriphagus sp. H41]|uniref:Addiction module component n=1 Tax=Algoriphagus oliviformis TaxID=2811231 RepID=A0ABS3C1N9_9BACT|nr:hypothetical protein [Algoriphagus oliviformis]MBN7810100.1 hypothetical protein [Algoriphagus oliviformis]